MAKDQSDVLKEILKQSKNPGAIQRAQEELTSAAERKAEITAQLRGSLSSQLAESTEPLKEVPRSQGALSEKSAENIKGLLKEAKDQSSSLKTLIKLNQKSIEDNSEVFGRLEKTMNSLLDAMEERTRKTGSTAEYGPEITPAKSGGGSGGSNEGGSGGSPGLLDMLGMGGKGKGGSAPKGKMSGLRRAGRMAGGALAGGLLGGAVYGMMSPDQQAWLNDLTGGHGDLVAEGGGALLGAAPEAYAAYKDAKAPKPMGTSASQLAAEYGSTAEKAAATAAEKAAESGGVLSKAKGVLSKGATAVSENAGSILKTGGKLLSRAATPLTVGVEGYQSYEQYQEAQKALEEGKLTKDQANIEKAKAVGGGIGGIGGALAGASAGASSGAAIGGGIGALFGGVGAVPGAAIGGAIGGIGGGIVGAISGRGVGENIAEGGTRLYQGTRDMLGSASDTVSGWFGGAKKKVTGAINEVSDAYGRGTSGTLEYQESYKNAREEWRQLGGEDSDTEGFNAFYDEKQKQLNKTGANRMATTSLAGQSKLEENIEDGKVNQKFSKGITSEKSLFGSTTLGALVSKEGLNTGSFTGTSMDNNEIKELHGKRTSGGLFGADKYEIFDGKDFVTVDKSTYMKMKDEVENNNIEAASKTLNNFKKFMQTSQQDTTMTAMGDMGAPGTGMVGNIEAVPAPKNIEPPAQSAPPIIVNKEGDVVNNVTNNNTSGGSSGGGGSPSRTPSPWDSMLIGNTWEAYP